jgi:hypothetical protein
LYLRNQTAMGGALLVAVALSLCVRDDVANFYPAVIGGPEATRLPHHLVAARLRLRDG